MLKKLLYLLAVSLMASSMVAKAGVLTEDFNAPFPAWESGWFGVNSDAYDYYCARPCANRGNNLDGLWLGGVSGPGAVAPIQVSFNNGFGSTITSLAIDVAGYAPTTLSVYDIANSLIFQQAITLTAGALSDPGVYANYVINSSDGIGRFTFDSFSAAGNTSIDNLVVDTNTNGGTVPEPATLSLLGLGLAGLGFMRRRKAS